MRNIFCVESPLQLKSAVDLIEVKNLDNCFFIVRLNGSLKNDEQLISLLNEHACDYISWTVKPHSKKILILIIIAWIKSLLFYYSSNFFLGDFRCYWQRLFSIFKKKINIIDDGLATINTINHLNVNTTLKKFKVLTQLPIKKDSYKNVDIEFIHKKYNSKPIDNKKCLIIGSPLVEKEITSFECWKKMISKIVSDLNGDITYIPHRAEQKIYDFSFDNLNIISINSSIESYLENLETLPGIVCSFYSTALVNLSTRYNGPSYRSYQIPVDFIESRYKVSTLNAYMYIKNIDNIQMHDL
ncbi:hypothetical protein RYX27_17835 [Providencia hangzhouensis]